MNKTGRTGKVYYFNRFNRYGTPTLQLGQPGTGITGKRKEACRNRNESAWKYVTRFRINRLKTKKEQAQKRTCSFFNFMTGHRIPAPY